MWKHSAVCVIAIACGFVSSCVEAEPFVGSDGTDSDSSGNSDGVQTDVKDDVTLPNGELTDTPCSADTECASLAEGTCQTAICHGTGVCMVGSWQEGETCNDDPCTEGATCVAGSCEGGAPRPCDDEIDCTEGLCDPGTGECTQDASACECTQDADCDDEDGCTIGSCDQFACVYTPQPEAPCSDGTASTTDATCIVDVVAGDCVGGPDEGAPCEDGGDCTSGICDGAKWFTSCLGNALVCDDENPCTDDDCDGLAGCEFDHNTDPCDDGDACTEDDLCSDGSCQPGGDLDCDDDNPCTLDDCKVMDGCVYTTTPGIACDDLNDCTGHFTPEVDEETGLTVYKDFCESVPIAQSGTCVSTGEQSSDDDGVSCTQDEQCPDFDVEGILQTCQDILWTGACKGPEIECDDGNECTSDICELGEGCTSEGISNVLCHEYDDNPCYIGNVLCDLGSCSPTADNELDCDDQNPCTDDWCDPSAQEDPCQHDPVEEAGCDDGNACTLNDLCDPTGQCVGTPLDCEDNNECTTEYCSIDEGCILDSIEGKPCDDGDACTITDVCSDEGVCEPGDALDCDDGKACTTDQCVEGDCINTSSLLPCDDEDACTVSEACNDEGDCVGEPLDCENEGPCKPHTCDSSVGCVALDPEGLACDDGNPCTLEDLCGSNGSCLGNGTVDCDDGNPCTEGECNPGDGSCIQTNTSSGCDDSNPCTLDDTCTDSQCAGTDISCDDGLSCSVDSCDETTGGCQFDLSECGCASDGDCDDGNVCTTELCTDGQCSPTPVPGLECDDNNACTNESACNETGLCRKVAGTEVDCDDDNPCTVDICLDDQGTAQCVNEPLLGAACDDGEDCTIEDVCVVTPPNAGPTCEGQDYECPSAGECMTGTCVGVVGGELACSYTAGTGACSDEDACTEEDACDPTGQCVGIPIDCTADDMPFCRLAYCNPTNGACVSTGKPIETPCDDDNPCTVGDHCHGTWAACVGGTETLDCDDGNSCTHDSCSVLVEGGCTHSFAQGLACDDDNPCTSDDTCGANGSCQGAVVDCDDGNPCTVESCDQDAGGCTYAITEGFDCDDSDQCTVGDLCSAQGACTPGVIESWAAQPGSGSGYDVLFDTIALSEGGWISVGERFQGGNNGRDAWIVRFDATGNTLWSKTFGGPGQDTFVKVALRPNENQLVAVGSCSMSAGDENDPTIHPCSAHVKVSNGESLTELSIHQSPGRLFSVQTIDQENTNVAGYVVAGEMEAYGGAGHTGLLAKLDAGLPQVHSPTWAINMTYQSKENSFRVREAEFIKAVEQESGNYVETYLLVGLHELNEMAPSGAQPPDGIVAAVDVQTTQVIWEFVQAPIIVGGSGTDRLRGFEVFEDPNGGETLLAVGSTQVINEENDLDTTNGWIVVVNLAEWELISASFGSYVSGQEAGLHDVAFLNEISSGTAGFAFVGRALNAAGVETGWRFENKAGAVGFDAADNIQSYSTEAGLVFHGIAKGSNGTRLGIAGSAVPSANPDGSQGMMFQALTSGEICGF